MNLALDLARKSEGQTNPNPLVGAVIVKSGKVVAKGYHEKAGLPHAEAIALNKAGTKARGADLYVNLEPCCHHGRTPPCTEAIISAGIKRVILGIRDPNRLVNGRGIRFLRKQGVEVVIGVLRRDCHKINEHFIKYITTGRPWVILKSAASLDGKIATRTGDSKWITGSKARAYAHRLRSRVDAILVGAETVRMDDPQLTVRPKKKGMRNPVRIIVSGKGSISTSAKIFNNAHKERVIYVANASLPLVRKKKLQKIGVEVLLVKYRKKKVDLPLLMDALGKMKITSIMIEGGSEISGNALKEKLVDKLIYFLAPKIIGGKNAPGPVGGQGISRIEDFIEVKEISIEKLGNDFVIEGNIY
ncbi:MAG: bifunctional diaminohydroxyphosphoribosylaminopyrimidine deaminase/5-amino-6-(5-phosphoribosylamino)uracil reductase RibD [Nitrospina sp.]|nr:bifunctional diaminohydroxyphosphoribosylaminopyrimidine deaminase/5-amino-6-(5-phosphoribosylamino)uracil reductase RibD [Nitrospina sp.]